MTGIRLERFAETHLHGIAAFVEDEEVQRFTRMPVPPPPDFERVWLERYENGRRDGTREAFAIVEAEDEFLGIAVAPRIDAEARTAELGYIVVPAARGRGVATRALELLSDWALSELGALRLELLISAGNGASKRVAERCGYVREGVLRSLYVKPGVREDMEIWSLLPDDRPSDRAG